MNQTSPLESIFFAALEKRTPTERRAFLDEACAGDAQLRARVELMLQAEVEAASFLEQPAVAEEGAAFRSSPISEQPGDMIGPYKLLEQIGEGGMGVVFMAEQSEPIHRTVALKIIKPGMDTRQVIARFEAERQALAMMDHPNIARVLDAGTTGAGGLGRGTGEEDKSGWAPAPSPQSLAPRPFFVMELVKGVPITKYCDAKQLTIRQRLELFKPVCEAVQHAHQKGIIHRDIKPTNVLVAEYDNRAVPKIIDFGVAKATAQRLTERTMFTEFGQLIGTFEYMSPEQAKFNQLDVDTRSDIYSLGVLLYELFTGSTPFERERLREAAFDEVLRIIREEDPPKPSTRLSAVETLPSIATNRQTEPARLSKEISGELDWIVMRSLEKERGRRYQTASGLARDIECHLRDEPVEASPPSKTYRLKKFARRNRISVLAGAAIVVAILAGAILASIGFIQARRHAVRANHEAKNARTQAARSERVAQFLGDTLKAAGPAVARGRDAALLREVLENTAAKIDHELESEPEVRGDLWRTIGRTYREIGDYPTATGAYQHAVDSYRSAFGEENAKLAQALGGLGVCQSFRGDVKSGKANAARGLEMARKAGDPDALCACLVCVAQSFMSWNRFPPESVPYWREAIELKKQLGASPVEVAKCMDGLATALGSESEEGEKLARHGLAIYRDHLGMDSTEYVGSLFVLGQKLAARGNLDEAEQVLRESFNKHKQIYDANHPFHPIVRRIFIEVLVRRGNWVEIESVLLADMEKYPTDTGLMHYLGGFYAFRGDLPKAIEYFSRGQGPRSDFMSFELAIVLMQAGRREEYVDCCHVYLEHATAAQAMDTKSRAAVAALLLPTVGADFDRACEFAEAEPSNSWGCRTKALAQYRQGRFDDAKQYTKLVIDKKNVSPRCMAAIWFIDAAASTRLNDYEAAQAALDAGDELVQQHSANIEVGILDIWRDWAIADILRREAVERMKASGGRPSVDKQPVEDQLQKPQNLKP